MKFQVARAMGIVKRNSKAARMARHKDAITGARDLRKKAGQGCYWCGLPFEMTGDFRQSKEHVNPRSNGGTSEPSNIAASHLLCNNVRSSHLNWVPFATHGRRGMWAKRKANGDIEPMPIRNRDGVLL